MTGFLCLLLKCSFIKEMSQQTRVEIKCCDFKVQSGTNKITIDAKDKGTSLIQ